MNPETNNCNCKARLATALAVLGAFLIVLAIVAAARHYTRPEPLNANRAAERTKGLADVRAADHEALNSAGWVDQGKGVVRLKLSDALTMVQQWQDPAVVRSNLLARLAKANPPPPPPKPSAFE